MRAYSIFSLLLVLWISLQATAFPLEVRKNDKKPHGDDANEFGGQIEEQEDIARGLGVPITEVPNDLTEAERNYWATKGAAEDPETDKDEGKNKFHAKKPKKGSGILGHLKSGWNAFKHASDGLVEWEHKNLKMPSTSPGSSGVLGGLASELGELGSLF